MQQKLCKCFTEKIMTCLENIKELNNRGLWILFHFNLFFFEMFKINYWETYIKTILIFKYFIIFTETSLANLQSIQTETIIVKFSHIYCFANFNNNNYIFVHVFFIHMYAYLLFDLAIQFSSVQSLSHIRLCDPMNRSTPGLPVHHHLLEFTQTHVH